MTDRARLVYALLRTLLAWVSAPRSRMGLDRVPRGFADPDTRSLSCPDCLANDKPQGMPGCETCGGRGKIPDPARDPYDTGKARGLRDGRVQVLHRAAADDDAKRARRERDLEIERLEQQTASYQTKDDEPGEDDSLTRAIGFHDRLERQGSYAELWRQLERLRDEQPAAHAVAMMVAYQPFGEAPVEPVSRVVEKVCELLALRMDGPIRVPAFVPLSEDADRERLLREGKGALWHGKTDWHRGRLGQRNQLIVAMAAQGVSTRAIGLRFNLTRQHVRRILNRHVAQREETATGPAA